MNRIGQLQRRLSDHVHQSGDEHADQAGWTITTTTGLLGFAARTYRDPRFDRQPCEGVTGDGAPTAAAGRDRFACPSDDRS